MPTAIADPLDMLPAALAGDEEAARAYARAWSVLVRELLADHPDAPPSAAAVLDQLAVTAPFDRGGPLRALVSVAEGIIGPMPAPPAATATELPSALEYRRFARTVLSELAGPGTGLERLLAAWQLSITEAAELFGVRRQAVQQWLGGNVPASRQPKLLTVQRIADLLERNLEVDRIPRSCGRRPPPTADGPCSS